jgi:hypothetical protein
VVTVRWNGVAEQLGSGGGLDDLKGVLAHGTSAEHGLAAGVADQLEQPGGAAVDDGLLDGGVGDGGDQAARDRGLDCCSVRPTWP